MLLFQLEYSNKTADGESLDLYLKRVFCFWKYLFWKKNEKGNEIKFWTFVWTCYTRNKYNMENVIFFLIQSKYNLCKFHIFNFGTLNAIQKKFV